MIFINIQQRIKEISENKFNGYQIIPNFNPLACEILDKISKDKNIRIQHAMNEGEFYIGDLGYWVDGYDKENNIIYEFYEKKAFRFKWKFERKIYNKTTRNRKSFKL